MKLFYIVFGSSPFYMSFDPNFIKFLCFFILFYNFLDFFGFLFS